MMEKEPIDDFFKRKLEEADLSYQEAYWLKAQALLEAEEKKKRRILLFRWFSFGTLLLLLAWGAWNWSNLSDSSRIQQHTELGVGSKADKLSDGRSAALTSVSPIANQSDSNRVATKASTNKVNASADNDNINRKYDQDNQPTGVARASNFGLRSKFSGKRLSRAKNNTVRGQEVGRLNEQTLMTEMPDSIQNSAQNYIEFQAIAILNQLPARLLSEEAVLGPEFNKQLLDSIGKKSKNLTTDAIKKKSRTDLEVFIQAPISSAFGLGLRRTQYLGRSTSLIIGLSAQSQHQLDQSLTWDSTIFDFGFRRSQYELKPLWMLEGIAHIGLLIQLHRSHAISAGFNWHTPIYGLNEVSHTRVSNFEQSQKITTQEWGGNSNLYNSFSVQLGYEFAWNSQLNFGIYWIGQRRNWHSSTLDPIQDFSQLKLSGRWKLW